MNTKKIIALVAVLVLTMSSLAFAAKGGAKVSSPKTSTPSISSQQKSTTPAASPSTNSKEYKPSQDAKAIDKNAPAAKTNTAAATNTGSSWGGMLRNVGLFAGGMMLGSMLGSMFGMGGGFMADILGLLMNVALLAAAFVVIRLLWNKFRSKGRKEDVNPYRSVREETMQAAPTEKKFEDVKPPATGEYDSKSKADEYRNR